MGLHDCEPAFDNCEVVEISSLMDGLVSDRRLGHAGPFLLAIDGRSSNGKSSLAARIAAVTPGAQVVHTDDIAWWHSRFGWDDLLISGVIEPLRRGEDVSFRPPTWDARARPGAITVSGDAPLVIIEGVGAGRRSLQRYVDAVIWVQADLDITERRNATRVAARELDRDGYEGWMAEEVPFQNAERTWERADVIINGSPIGVHAPNHVVVLR